MMKPIASSNTKIIATTGKSKAILSKIFPSFPSKWVEDNDLIVYSKAGYAVGGFDKPSEFYIRDIFVTPEFRRTGVASSLLKELMNRSGAKRFLGTPTISGEKFFREMGFKRTKSGTVYKQSQEVVKPAIPKAEAGMPEADVELPKTKAVKRTKATRHRRKGNLPMTTLGGIK